MLPEEGGGLTFFVLFVVEAVMSGSCMIFTLELELNAGAAFASSVKNALKPTVTADAATTARNPRIELKFRFIFHFLPILVHPPRQAANSRQIAFLVIR